MSVLVLVFLACAVVGSFLLTSSTDAYQTRMALDYQRAGVAADAGIDYGLIKLRDVLRDYRLSPDVSRNELQTRLDAIPPPPSPMDRYVYRTPGGGPAFRISVDSDVLTGTITNGTTCRGSDGAFQYFTVTCGALNPSAGGGAVVRQKVHAVSLSVFRYGVFYDEDLEILPGSAMYFYGRVHCNGDMYVGSDGNTLSFFDRVTAHGDVFRHRKDSNAYQGAVLITDGQGHMTPMDTDDGTHVDSDHPNWMTESLLRWRGNMMSRSHEIARLRPPLNAVDTPHDIIERPLDPTDPAYHPETEDEKFSNKAALRIGVSADGSLTVRDHAGNDLSSAFRSASLMVSGTESASGRPLYAKDANGAYLMSTNGAYSAEQNTFFDAREQCVMAPVDIYIDRLLQSVPSLYNGAYSTAQGRGIVYVTRDDPDGEGTGVRPCVRLRNGQSITPQAGLTIVSDLPVYVEGTFNAANGVKPVLVGGDAVTLLSKNWQDARSTLGGSARLPADTSYNLAVMTGNHETKPGAYNGGLENVLRFLEDWSASPQKTARFRGSIIDLWEAEKATQQWYYGTGPSNCGVPFRYTAPQRDWGYDDIYRTLNPPGTTKVLGMEELERERVTWRDAGWQG